ncbi:DUF4435 domain-containing protein [Yersinia enterocolitica]|uniref:DUF4435 domain-containing protein n=1 Tax=Yersinia TaxID=629 RepID=UPI0005DF8C73|nr:MULTISPECIES: DUF4435 domain-containing protein [Yersinia]EKN6132895.1 DUF4435 domain-containing protein [Yersinia enterocolitica]CNH75968.1 Uncharacterised protein [Yersinia aldovae]CQH26758.1 Uncharacterised protein [Yersinia enterocolitica]HDL8415695.1 DUF4435 domain-containing protein [Yersinia enterocolitica]
MADLVYSDEAENVLNFFYQTDYMVYVEGPDDIPFWEAIFKKFPSITVEIQDVGGCNELIPYIERITSNKISALVACDSDLKIFGNDFLYSPKIIRTYGYSIENSFINEKSLARVLKSLGRISARDMQNVNIHEWISNFNEKVSRLIYLDIYNYVNSKGVSVVGDNAERFMKSKSSFEVCDIKLDQFINSLPLDFIELDIEMMKQIVLEKEVPLSFWLRGHFLFSAAQKFVSCYLQNIGKKISLSNDAFYSNLIIAFESLFNDTHEQYDFYKNQIECVA